AEHETDDRGPEDHGQLEPAYGGAANFATEFEADEAAEGDDDEEQGDGHDDCPFVRCSCPVCEVVRVRACRKDQALTCRTEGCAESARRRGSPCPRARLRRA